MTLNSLSKLQKNKNDFITSLEKLTPKLKHNKFIEDIYTQISKKVSFNQFEKKPTVKIIHKTSCLM